MSRQATANFEVTGWTPAPYSEAEGAPTLSRVTVTKAFTGDLEGTSTAELLTCVAADGSAGYIAQELFEGSLGERAGTFVMQHGGLQEGSEQKAYGSVVPGSGTGGFHGLRGEVRYRHDEHGAVFTMEYDMP